MQFSCRACGQQPFPSIRPYQEQIDNRLNAVPNTYTDEAPSFKLLAERITPYVESLKKELEAANKILQTALELSAPISRVHNDVLLYIFQEVFFVGGECAEPDTIHPFTLVCRRWRDLIISTPKFWTRIYAPDFVSRSRKSEDSLFQFLEILLDRASGTLPLTLDFSFPMTSRWSNLLQPVWDRITSFHTNPCHAELHKVIKICALLPKLSSLRCFVSYNFDTELDDYFDARDMDPIGINLTQSNAPLLTDVTLDVPIAVRYIDFPWNQITVLRLFLQVAIYFDLQAIIVQLGNIVELELNLDSYFEHESLRDRLQGVTLPRLHTLILVDHGEESLLELVQQINLPSLKVLDIKSPRDGQFIEAMRNPSIWNTTRLKLQIHSWQQRKIDEIMGSLRKFERLEAFSYDARGEPYHTYKIFQLLDRDHSSDGRLFPCLAELEILRAVYNQETYASSQELLKSHVSPVSVPVNERQALRKVRVDFEYIQDPSSPRAREVQKPACLNDNGTSVIIDIRGK